MATEKYGSSIVDIVAVMDGSLGNISASKIYIRNHQQQVATKKNIQTSNWNLNLMNQQRKQLEQYFDELYIPPISNHLFVMTDNSPNQVRYNRIVKKQRFF